MFNMGLYEYLNPLCLRYPFKRMHHAKLIHYGTEMIAM